MPRAKAPLTILGSAGYQRACQALLDSSGVTADTLFTHEFKKPEERWQACAAESIACALKAFEARDTMLGFRATLQAHHYAGRAGGLLPGPALNDALLACRMAVEDTLRSGGAND